jgi:outer membrane lipoprotein-sorting protein
MNVYRCINTRNLSAAIIFMGIVVLAAPGQAQDASTSDTEAAIGKVSTKFVKNGKLDLAAVVAHFEDLYRSTGSIAEAELTMVKPRRTRTMRLKSWTQGEDKALFIIESPVRDKGTATLKVDKNLWNYLPRIKRTIRIPPSMMQSSWMGSDFTNDDLVRESSFENDYTYTFEGRSIEPAGWKIAFTAKPGVVGLWNRFELILSEDGTLPVQAQYFDRKDRLARTIYWDDVKMFGTRQIPAHMTLVPEDEEGQRTEMRYLEMEFDVKLPESTFSLSRLEQSR